MRLKTSLCFSAVARFNLREQVGLRKNVVVLNLLRVSGKRAARRLLSLKSSREIFFSYSFYLERIAICLQDRGESRSVTWDQLNNQRWMNHCNALNLSGNSEFMMLRLKISSKRWSVRLRSNVRNIFAKIEPRLR